MGARSVMSEILGHKFDLAVATVSCKIAPKRSPPGTQNDLLPTNTEEGSEAGPESGLESRRPVSDVSADVADGASEMHFLVKTLTRKVPCKEAGAANTWADQREIVILPTMRVRNTLRSDVAVRLHGTREEADAWLTSLARGGKSRAAEGKRGEDNGRESVEGGGGTRVEGANDVGGERVPNGEVGLGKHEGEGASEEGDEKHGAVVSEMHSVERHGQMNGFTESHAVVSDLASQGNSINPIPQTQNSQDAVNARKSGAHSDATTSLDGNVSEALERGPPSKQPTRKVTLAQAASFFQRNAPKNPLEGIDGLVMPGRGQEICLHGNPANAFMSVYHPHLGASVEPVSLAESGLVDLASVTRETTPIAGWGSAKANTGSDLEVRFGRGEKDRKGSVVVRVARDADGVLKLSLHVR
jgi:hypothetical protein